jgi:hypothetical protein
LVVCRQDRGDQRGLGGGSGDPVSLLRAKLRMS